MGVGCEEGDESEGAEDVGDGEQSLGYQGRMPHLPLFPWTRGVVLEGEEKNEEAREEGRGEQPLQEE